MFSCSGLEKAVLTAIVVLSGFGGRSALEVCCSACSVGSACHGVLWSFSPEVLHEEQDGVWVTGKRNLSWFSPDRDG